MTKTPIAPPDDSTDSPGLTRRTALQGAGILALTAAIGLSNPATAFAAANPWDQYQNGHIPLSALTPISWQSNHRLWPSAAAALVTLNAQFRARFGVNIAISDSYRSFAAQVQAKKDKPTLAAKPGTSIHGWGYALDLGSGINNYSTAQHQWMRANAPASGWINPAWAWRGNGKEEPWHWEYQGGPSTAPAPTPIPTPEPNVQEDDMLLIRDNSTGAVMLVIGGIASAVLGPDYAAYQAAGIPVANVSADGFAIASQRYLQR